MGIRFDEVVGRVEPRSGARSERDSEEPKAPEPHRLCTVAHELARLEARQKRLKAD